MVRNIMSLKRIENGIILAELENGKFIKAKQVVIGTTAKELASIDGVNDLISKERQDAISGCKPIALFKCFLHFPTPWWTDHGFTSGKSTCYDKSRQVHYYDGTDLLVYCSDGDSTGTVGDTYASDWQRMILEHGSQHAFEKMFEQIKTMHIKMGVPEDQIPLPNYDQCVHAYWPSGSHKWKTGVDVRNAVSLIPDGQSDGSNIFIVGEAFSAVQGWVQGAIQTCDIAFEKMDTTA